MFFPNAAVTYLKLPFFRKHPKSAGFLGSKTLANFAGKILIPPTAAIRRRTAHLGVTITKRQKRPGMGRFCYLKVSVT